MGRATPWRPRKGAPASSSVCPARASAFTGSSSLKTPNSVFRAQGMTRDSPSWDLYLHRLCKDPFLKQAPDKFLGTYPERTTTQPVHRGARGCEAGQMACSVTAHTHLPGHSNLQSSQPRALQHPLGLRET